MQIAKDKVATFDFTVTDDGGMVLDSSEQFGPFGYIHGIGYLVPGLEAEMEGKSPGDAFSVTIPPATAYGVRDESLIQVIPRDRFAGISELQVGMRTEAHYEDGPKPMLVTRMDDDSVTVDGNHPLAGLTLNFDVKVLEVRDATDEELAHGHLAGEGCDCGGSCEDHGECHDECCGGGC